MMRFFSVIKSYIAVLILLVISLSAMAQESVDENTLYQTIFATLLVSDPELTAGRIALWAEQSGGYYLQKANDRVTIRYPYEASREFRQILENEAEEVVELIPETVDIREGLLGIRSAITSREEILEKNLSFIDEADVAGTLAIEKEIMQLLMEIEDLKGRLRKLETDRTFSRGDVYLNTMEETLPEDIPSSFGWINSVNVYSLLDGGMFPISSRGRITTPVPEGFAELKSKKTILAVSPEGMTFRVRTVDNYPSMDLEFWSEASRIHMEKEGYRIRSGEGDTYPLTAGDTVVYEWVVPYGTRSYIYLTALSVSGKRIAVAEAAGEHGLYKLRRESLLDTLENLKVH